MPQSVQIVPKYTYPHVETYINDNTEVDLTENPVNSSMATTYNYLSVFTSERGIDNKLVNITNKSEFTRIFGSSNFKLYGQPLMQAEAIVNQSNNQLWAMRVMPSDSLYANTILSLWYKADKATAEDGTPTKSPKFRIKATVKSLSKYKEDGKTIDPDMLAVVSSRDGIIKYGKTSSTELDAEGYKQIPVAAITSAGRGLYGNNYKWNIAIDEEYEREYGFKLFRFNCYNAENGMTLADSYVASIVTSDKTTNVSFINDIIEDKGIENLDMDFHFYEDNVETLYDAYVEFLKGVAKADPTADVTIPELDSFDPFFGKQLAKTRVKTTANDPYLTIVKISTSDVDTTTADYVAANYSTVPDNKENLYSDGIVIVGDLSGISIYGGSDGSFTVDKINDPTGATRQAAIDKMYSAAFTGSLDKTILSPRRVDSAALFDANYSLSVKRDLAKLALFRNDAILYLDCGTDMSTISLADLTQLDKKYAETFDSLAEDFDPFNQYLLSYNIQYYSIRESETGKKVNVTIPYFFATIHGDHWRTYGMHQPMVGNTYATLSNHVKNSLSPSIEEYEQDLMESLNITRFNYFECTGENIFVRATQNTALSITSDLTEENNVNTLMFLKRSVNQDAKNDIYDFTSEENRSDFADFIKTKYSYMVGKQVLSMKVEYTMSEWEFERSIVHMYLAIQFRQLAKRVIVEIDLNKRTFGNE